MLTMQLYTDVDDYDGSVIQVMLTMYLCTDVNDYTDVDDYDGSVIH